MPKTMHELLAELQTKYLAGPLDEHLVWRIIAELSVEAAMYRPANPTPEQIEGRKRRDEERQRKWLGIVQEVLAERAASIPPGAQAMAERIDKVVSGVRNNNSPFDPANVRKLTLAVIAAELAPLYELLRECRTVSEALMLAFISENFNALTGKSEANIIADRKRACDGMSQTWQRLDAALAAAKEATDAN